MDLQQVWEQHGSTIIFVVVGLVAVFLLSRVLGGKKKVFAEDMTLNVRCPSCGWQGTVTKYNQTCRKCNSSELEKF